MLLELKNIKKYFPVKRGFFASTASYVKAVDDVGLVVNQGEHVSLVGESGCGKTTLARIIIKLVQSDSGSVILDGQDVTDLTGRQFSPYRKHLQMVFQDPYSSLDPRFTIRRIMEEAFALDKTEYASRSKREDRIRLLLEAVQLGGDILNRYPHEFSGGERQRIAIARALVLHPKLLILDEAVSSLDVIIQRQIIDLLADLQKRFNLTYIFISHNLKIVKKISHKIAVMYNGKIVEMASAATIFNNPLHPYTIELLSAAVDYKTVRKEAGVAISPGARLVDQGGGHFVLTG